MARPPKSTSEHEAAGTYRKDRHGAFPLYPMHKPPKAPTWLSAAAKKEWKEAAGKLCAAGVLTDLDLEALAAYCVAYATWKEAAETVAAEGATYTTDKGLKKYHPAVAVMQAADRAMRDWSGKLGLHPDARKKLRIEMDGKPAAPAPEQPRESKRRFFGTVG